MKLSEAKALTDFKVIKGFVLFRSLSYIARLLRMCVCVCVCVCVHIALREDFLKRPLFNFQIF